MQVIAADTPRSRRDRLAILRSAATGVLLILAGVLIGWLCLGTPLANSFIPDGRPTTFQTALGVMCLGVRDPGPGRVPGVRLHAHGPHDRSRDIAPAHDRDADPRPGARSRPPGRDRPPAARRPPDPRARARAVRDPRLGDVPPAGVSRHVGSRWEIRGARGRWVPIEAPLDRASRDAERVRGWLSTHDRDFLVRVYAAVVTDDPTRRPHADLCRRQARRPRRLARGAAGPARPQRRAARVARELIKSVAGSR